MVSRTVYRSDGEQAVSSLTKLVQCAATTAHGHRCKNLVNPRFQVCKTHDTRLQGKRIARKKAIAKAQADRIAGRDARRQTAHDNRSWGRMGVISSRRP